MQFNISEAHRMSEEDNTWEVLVNVQYDPVKNTNSLQNITKKIINDLITRA